MNVGLGRGGVKLSWVGLAGLATVITLAFAAPAANAVVVRLPSGGFQGVYLRPGVSAAAYERQTGSAPVTSAKRASTSAGSADNLVWGGGPVLHTSKPYLVFWDPNNAISSASRAVLTQYLTDAGLDSGNASDVYSYRVLAQYYDSTGFAAQGQTFASATQVIDDAAAYPSSACSIADQNGFTACITDTQFQTELTSLINTDHLPSGIGSNAPIYFVVTPQDVNVCQDGGGGCASNSFCAYHSSYTLPGTSTDVVYASIPFTSGSGCQAAGLSPVQEPNGDVADVIADNLSHENSEAVTDPLPNTAWLTSNGEEVADQCEAWGSTPDPNDPNGPSSPNAYLPTLGGSQASGTLYDQLINNDRYFTQTEWSNSDDNCMASPKAGTISPGFASPASVTPGASASFDPAASRSTNGYSSTTWSWGDGSANTFHAASPAATSHTYATGGTYTVTLTLVDAGGNTAKVSHTIIVGTPLTAAFSASGNTVQVGTPVTFDASGSRDPNPGQSITAYRWSFGDGAAASGAATSHAYASPGTYTATLTVTGGEGLTAMISRAVTIVAAPSSPPVSAPVNPPTASGKIAGVSVKHAKGRYYLLVTVSKAGTVRVGSARFSLRAPGKATFKLSLSRAQQRRLAKHKTVLLTLRIIYIPRSGPSVSQTRTVKLKT